MSGHCRRALRLQRIAQPHKFIHLGDNALLFGKRWKWKPSREELFIINCWIGDAGLAIFNIGSERSRTKVMVEKARHDALEWMHNGEGGACNRIGIKVLINDGDIKQVWSDC